jgi:hypothetical protein
MSSVKQLAARFESQQSPLSNSGRKIKSNGPTTDLDEENIHELTDAANFNTSSELTATAGFTSSESQSLTSRPPRDGIQSYPLCGFSKASTEHSISRSDPNYVDSIPRTHDPGPLPPSQPARFLNRLGTRVDEHPLTDLSTPSAISVSDSPALAQEFSRPEILTQTTTDLLSDSATLKPGSAGNDPPVQSSHSHPKGYRPMSATELFARNAAPLYLPELDEWLEKLPRFKFTHPKPESPPRPFPPLDLLNGERLKDLVYNSRPKPVWRDWNSIGSTVGKPLNL